MNLRSMDTSQMVLTSNLIVSIDEDSHGNLWIGTADRGVFLFNSVKNEFISLNIGHIGIDKNFTCDKILVDSKDRVWFHSSDESIYLVNYDFQWKNKYCIKINN